MSPVNEPRDDASGSRAPDAIHNKGGDAMHAHRNGNRCIMAGQDANRDIANGVIGIRFIDCTGRRKAAMSADACNNLGSPSSDGSSH
jgi:hypothetical protein